VQTKKGWQQNECRADLDFVLFETKAGNKTLLILFSKATHRLLAAKTRNKLLAGFVGAFWGLTCVGAGWLVHWVNVALLLKIVR